MGLTELESRGRSEQTHAQHEPSQQCLLRGITSSLSETKNSLIDPRFDHDSCGVGFVASVLGKADHKILQDALTALSRLEHRGAVAADGASSDGIGLMAAVPRNLLLAATGIDLGADETLGVGMVFWPQAETRAEAVLESCLVSQQLRVLAWRDPARDPWRDRAQHHAAYPAGSRRRRRTAGSRPHGAPLISRAQAVRARH